MNRRFFAFVAFIAMLGFSGIAIGQETKNDTANYPYWIKMMQDPNANFYETQKAFNKYWEGREITKGCGWKPFKRWESNMMFRVSPEGVKPAPDEVRNRINLFLEKNKGRATNANWQSIGPDNYPSKGYKGLGRLNAIAFHPTNENIIYAGAPSGGFWKTTTGGKEWITTTDNLPTLGVSSIAVDYTNPNIIYIGSGDRDASDAPGLGVFKSIDGGNTWTISNNGMDNVIVGKLLIHPTNNQTLYAATSAGVFKTVNAGENWSKMFNGNIKDLALKPGMPSTIYACGDGGFYYSTNDGNSWEAPSSGYNSGYRSVLAVTPADPNLVYVMTSAQQSFTGLYRSTNSGKDFTQMSNSPNILDWSCYGTGTGGQAWYDLCLVADHNDANIIYAGGVNIWKSANGGQNWEINAHWVGDCGVPTVHADHHVFEVNPINKKIYVGNDGGLYWTSNGGISWEEETKGMVISQAYKIGQSLTNKDVIMHGYQDNGSSVYDEGEWYFVQGGDGMECAVKPDNSNIRFASLYYGSISRIDKFYNEGSIAGEGVNGITEKGAWVTPFLIDHKIPNQMFIGYKNVWRSRNIDANYTQQVKWEKISKFGSSDLSNLVQSPFNTNIIFASFGSALFFTEDAQNLSTMPTWEEISSFLPNNDKISAIAFNPFEEKTVYIALDKKIFKSTDLGRTWNDISGNLPEIHINGITYYKNSNEGLYLATDAGVYYKDKFLSEWLFFNEGMPLSASVREIEIYYDPNSPAGDQLSAGTYGRGTWVSKPYSSAPNADFVANNTILSTDCGVDFSDLSSGVPFTWNWEFEGGTPSTSTSKNPQNIKFNNFGTFKVTLKVTNDEGSDIEVKNAYITVSDTVKPITDFYANKIATCDINDKISFTDMSEQCPMSWKWTFTPNNVTFVDGTNENSQNPVVVFKERNLYSVMLTATNSNGSRSLEKVGYIHSGGFSGDFVEDFEENSFDSKNWIVENPDNLMTWAITTVNGSEPGSKAAWMNFYDYRVTGGPRDRMITPPLSFAENSDITLTFDHSYASRFANFSDSLVIYISEDCGNTWKRIIGYGEKGQGTFATVENMQTSFAPQSKNDWCGGSYGSACKSIDLSQYAGKSGVKIAFESYNKFSNNLYIDNISIKSVVGTNLNQAKAKMSIYPNPTNKITKISCEELHVNSKLQIINMLGNIVYSKDFSANSVIDENIDVSKFSKGIYIVRVLGENILMAEKLVIQ